MRVLVDPGSHHLLNAGDVAMLQVALDRLREHAPRARVQVLTGAPELLAHHCPGAEPLPAEGRYAALARPPRRRSRVLLRLATRRRGGAERAYLDALLRADLLLLSGRGCLADAFADESGAMLAELGLAARIGLPSALVGQGIGPLEDPELRALARATLPHVGLLALREGRAGPALARQLGAAPGRTLVTGDDAIEPALSARPSALGTAIGLGVRAASYAQVTAADAVEVGERVRAVAARHGAALEPIRISSHPGDDEASAAGAEPTSGRCAGRAPGGASPDIPVEAAPATAIAAAGRCRVVVAGAYHAALFALAQGVPAVGVAGSPYYRDKLLGLDERFPGGCAVVALDRPDWPERLSAELERLWDAAPALRDRLLAGAASQVALSRAAHARAFALAA